MSCTKPLIAFRDHSAYMKHMVEAGKRKSDIVILKKDMSLPHDVKSVRDYRDLLCRMNYRTLEPLDLACGRCRGCRLQQSMDWTTRLVMEYLTSQNAWFLTFTYDDEHLPKSDLGFPTLRYEDVRKLNQDLTNHCLRDFNVSSPRHFFAGEYGSRTQRPHVHSIHYNLPITADMLKHYKSVRGYEYFTCDWLSDIWGKGYVVVGLFSPESAGYVARYVTKKLTGPLQDERFEKTGCLQEKNWVSNKPGIGSEWLRQNAGTLDKLSVVLPGMKGPRPIPGYIVDKFEDLEIFDVASMKAERKTINEERFLHALQVHNQSIEDYLKGVEFGIDQIYKKLPREGV